MTLCHSFFLKYFDYYCNNVIIDLGGIMKKISILALHFGYGGIEKSIAALANMLCDKYQIEIACTYKLFDEPVLRGAYRLFSARDLFGSHGRDPNSPPHVPVGAYHCSFCGAGGLAAGAQPLSRGQAHQAAGGQGSGSGIAGAVSRFEKPHFRCHATPSLGGMGHCGKIALDFFPQIG